MALTGTHMNTCTCFRKSGFPMELKQKLLLFQDFSDSSIVQIICFSSYIDFLVYISVVLKFLLMLTYMSCAHTYVYDKKYICNVL